MDDDDKLLKICERIIVFALKKEWFHKTNASNILKIQHKAKRRGTSPPEPQGASPPEPPVLRNNNNYYSNLEGVQGHSPGGLFYDLSDTTSHKVSLDKYTKHFWMAGFISIIWLLDQFALYGKQNEQLKTVLYLYNQNQTKIEWITERDCANEFKGMLTMSSFARTEKNPFTKIMKEDLVKPSFSVYNFMDILGNPIKYLTDVNAQDLQIINNIIRLNKSVRIDVIEVIKHIFPLRNNNNNNDPNLRHKYLLKSIHKDDNNNYIINENKKMKTNFLDDEEDSDDSPLLLSSDRNNNNLGGSKGHSPSFSNINIYFNDDDKGGWKGHSPSNSPSIAIIKGNKKDVKKLLSTLQPSLINSYQQINHTQQFLANIVSKTKK